MDCTFGWKRTFFSANSPFQIKPNGSCWSRLKDDRSDFNLNLQLVTDWWMQTNVECRKAHDVSPKIANKPWKKSESDRRTSNRLDKEQLFVRYYIKHTSPFERQQRRLECGSNLTSTSTVCEEKVMHSLFYSHCNVQVSVHLWYPRDYYTLCFFTTSVIVWNESRQNSL